MNADIALLESAAEYADDAIAGATPEMWERRTPCARWDLRMLLEHLCQSVTALHEGLATGRIALCPHLAAVEPFADPAAALRVRIAMLVDAWPPVDVPRTVAIADRDLAVSVMAGAAAIEIAVHGWDIAASSGYTHPMPPQLGADLLAVATRLLADGNRRSLFAAPVSLARRTDSSDELLAFLGRQPAGDFDREAC